MHTLYTLDADLKRIGAKRTIYAKQGDARSRKIKISLYSDGNPWTIPTGSTAIIRFRKADGKGGIYDKLDGGTAAYEIGGTRADITITLAAEVLTCPGDTMVDVALINSADVIGLFNIHVYVEPSPTAGITPSNNYYNYQSLADLNAALAARVQTVNNIAPDTDGNVNVPTGVTRVNSLTGNVKLPINALAECTTPPPTTIKSIGLIDGFSLLPGAIIAIKFKYSNTAGNPILSYGGNEMPILDRITGQPIAAGDITAGTYRFMASPTGWILLDKQQSSGSTAPVPGDPGEDGGWWIPSVDADGNLTWTASKDGMGDAPAPANIKGAQGDTGATPNLQIGAVTTLEAGSSATASITGTAANPILNLGIPKGADGASGGASAGVSAINGQSGDVKLPISSVGTCSTAAATRLKMVSVSGTLFDGTVPGALLAVKFADANTANAPVLNIGGSLYTVLNSIDYQPPAAALMSKQVHLFVLLLDVAVLLDPYLGAAVTAALEE